MINAQAIKSALDHIEAARAIFHQEFMVNAQGQTDLSPELISLASLGSDAVGMISKAQALLDWLG